MRLFDKNSRILVRLAGLVMLAVGLACCSPLEVPAGPHVRPPSLQAEHYIASDGTALPLSVWPATGGTPRAVILGIHGFGDYRKAWEEPAEIWAAAGITTYSWDQRGFGASPTRNRWAGTDSLVADVKAMTQLVRQRHPDVPLYVAGESMGGALALIAERDLAGIDGLILVAPALRSRDTMGGFLRGGLEFFAHTLPWFPVGPTSIDFGATDNPKTMEKLRRDPMILRNARVDVGYGLFDAMDAAKAVLPGVSKPYLMLQGMGDKLVPQDSVQSAIALLPRRPDSRLAFYKDGYHMLLRDKQGPLVARDILAWIADKRAPLPSGADAEKSRPEMAELWGSRRPP